jgi:hypothetical protein
MRHLVLVLLCAGLLALPARAEAPKTFDDVIAALDGPLGQGDTEAAMLVLAQALRDARVGGWLTPDWAIFYAMQADFTRLERGNPAYALQLTEDGLAMIASDPGQADFAAALRVSQSYALADLGRFAEAAQTARLALPAFRRQFGDADADDLAAHADAWAEGRLTEYNTSAVDLAGAALERAYAARSEGAHGRAIAIAAGAILPLGTDLPEMQVRGIDFEAEKLIADSLAALGRIPDSVAASRRAIDHLTRTPWRTDSPIDWWPQRWNDDDRAVVFDALTELAPRAMKAGQRDLGIAALREAGGLATTSDQRLLLLLLQASLAFRGGDVQAALDLIAETGTGARADGDRALAAMTVFYDAIVRARQNQRESRDTDPAPVIAATEAALALGADVGGIDRLLLLSEAAQVLADTPAHGTALIWAREALGARRAALGERRDSAYAEAQARLGQRGLIETFLRAAHDTAGGLDPTRDTSFCPASPGFDSCVVAVRRH